MSGDRNVSSSDLTAMHENIKNELKSTEQILTKYFQSGGDGTILVQLENVPFYVEVYRNDSIIFWNDRTQTGDNLAEKLVQVGRLGSASDFSVIYINLYSQGKSDYFEKLGEQYGYKLETFANNQGAKTLQVGKGEFSVVPALHSSTNQRGNLTWFLLFLSLVLYTCSIVRYKVKKIGSELNFSHQDILLLTIVLAFAGLHWTQPFYQFLGISGSFTTNLQTPNLYKMTANLWFAGWLIYYLHKAIPHIQWIKKIPCVFVFICGLYIFIIFGFSTHVIEKWILDSSVNLEISALLEFNLSSFGVIFSVIWMVTLIFHSTQLLFERIHTVPVHGVKKFGLILFGWACGFGVLSFLNIFHVPFWIFLIFIIAYTLILDAYTEKREKKVIYLIWWLVLFSGFLAVTIFHFGIKRDIASRLQFSENYFHEFDNDVVRKMEQLNDSLVAGDIFTRIASLETPSKIDKFDFHAYIFSKQPSDIGFKVELFEKRTGVTLFTNHFADYYKLNQSFVNARRCGKNIFHNPFENKYYSRFEIARSQVDLGSWYLFVIYDDPTYDDNFDSDAFRDFGYAVFNKNLMIEKVDISQVTPERSLLESVFQTSINQGYSFVVSIPSDQFRIISWKKVSGLIKPISLFSFIFVLSGLMLILMSIVNTRYDFLPNNFALKFGSRSSLKTKIQLSIILLIVVTFVVIGLITGLYFKNLILANQKSRHNEETSSIVNGISSSLQNMEDQEYALNYINSKLKDISYIHNKDLSLHDKDGKLIGSTMGKYNLVRIPYSIWKRDNIGNQDLYQSENQNLRDQEYVPLYLGENFITREAAFAYIGIDHKTYNSSANILDFLSTILNAYIFLFLIAGAMAITIANSITQPLSKLAEKLKKFKLGKSNELLEWKSNDEIGTLIHDYNNLTLELERSAGLLAKTERDMAWREMAKQVAHEIKNPLTPMKLSIQYLDRAAKDHPDKAKEMVPRISATLIEQIDNLTQIANEFSNFAAMPQATNEKIILNEIVETIHDLFRKRDDMEIHMIEPIDDLYVFADRNHLVRILNNLLKNAIQAIPESRRGKIEIELKRQNNDAIIRISDNGTGIPDHMKDKVFTPNFTTKSSGTGLGLAISANMIDSFNGRIYFETKVGKGTDFYVSIPLMRLDDYLSDETRVTLD